jgi:hypothetical protein
MSEDIETLRSRVAELESALGLKNETLTSLYKLTPAMTSLLGLLVELPIVHDEIIQERLKLAANAKVAVYRLRRQLEAHDIQIHSRRGSGWFLDEETKQRIQRDLTTEVMDAAA